MGATEETVRRSARVLAAFMSQAEAQGFAWVALDQAAFLQAFQQRAAVRPSLQGPYVAPRIEKLPAEAAPHVAALHQNSLYASAYGVADIEMVELGKLVAAQNYMDTDVSDGVHGAKAQGIPTLDEILKICLPIDIYPQLNALWQRAGNTLTVYSLNNTMNLHGPGVDLTTGQVTYNVAAGANLMMVLEFNGRYVLANG